MKAMALRASPSRCGPSAHATSDGQTPEFLPASDAIPLHVMWPRAQKPVMSNFVSVT